MEISFGKDSKPAVEVMPPPNNPPTPSTPPPASAAGVPAVRNNNTSLAPGGLVLGDKLPDFSEILLPRLNIVQNIGQLKESFPNGALVLSQQISLFIPPLINAKTQVVERAATPPAIITVLGFRPTRFCEKMVGGVKGMIVNTEAEVRAAGGTLDYNEWKLKKEAGMKRFEPLADALVVVERPEIAPDDDTLFTYVVDGKKCALALWAMHGVVYTAGAKRVFFTARAVGCLREGGYPSWTYSIATREEKYPNGNTAWIPVCLPIRKSTPAFIEFARQVLNAPSAEAAAE